MQTHLIISYDGTDNDNDALALGGVVGLGAVADVCERHTGTGVAEDAAERERVVVVVGAVVGDDDVGLHGLFPRVRVEVGIL